MDVPTTLDTLLTKEQLKELKKLVERNEKRKLKPDSIEYGNSLKDFFRKYHKELVKKGVLPDYLAYWLSYRISMNPEAFKQQLGMAIKNLKKVV